MCKPGSRAGEQGGRGKKSCEGEGGGGEGPQHQDYQVDSLGDRKGQSDE